MIQARESRMPRNASCQKKLSFAEDTSSSSERVEDAISSDGVSDSKQHRDSSLPELAIDLLFEQKGASRTMIQEDWPNGAGPLGEQQSKKISGGTDGSALDDDAKSEREGSGSSTVAVEDRTRQNDGGFADENCNVNSNDGTSLRGMDPLAKALLAQTRAWEFLVLSWQNAPTISTGWGRENLQQWNIRSHVGLHTMQKTLHRMYIIQ